MEPTQLRRRLALAEQAAREAGEMLRRQREIQVHVKGMHDFVTQVDLACENLLRERLLTAFPEDGFYGEETGEGRAASGRWVVDPIDGTTNFIRHNPFFCVSIAYEAMGEILLGVVYAPMLDEMYVACKGMGATRNADAIHVSNVSDPQEAIVHISFAHRDAAMHEIMLSWFGHVPQLNDMRRTGTAALDLCYVAAGRAEAFVEASLHLYDIAAGLCILREAGGLATGWPGGAPCEESGCVIASNGHMHAYLEKSLKDTLDMY